MRLLAPVFLLCSISAASLAGVPPQPGEKERCMVCGMFVAPYPQWMASIELKDGRQYYFDGPKDMFICLFDLATYFPDTSMEQVTGVYVTEYYGGKILPASDVIFVTGSDVIGPMGAELVPVLGLDAATTFRRDHAGKALMRFDGKQLVEVVEQL